jgi:hypothetical protein
VAVGADDERDGAVTSYAAAGADVGYSFWLCGEGGSIGCRMQVVGHRV